MRRAVLPYLPVAPTLAQLDARSKNWPFPARVFYLTAKWSLVSLGAYLVLGLAVQQWHDGQFGFGIGVVTVVTLAIIIGVVNALRGESSGPSPPHRTAPK